MGLIPDGEYQKIWSISSIFETQICHLWKEHWSQMFMELTKSHMSNKWWKLRTELCHKVNKLEIIVLHNKGFSGRVWRGWQNGEHLILWRCPSGIGDVVFEFGWLILESFCPWVSSTVHYFEFQDLVIGYFFVSKLRWLIIRFIYRSIAFVFVFEIWSFWVP